MPKVSEIDYRMGQAHPKTSTLVWENERILAINKASGLSLATPKTKPGEAVTRLLDSLRPEDRAAIYTPAESLFLVHRLDVGTSGLILVAKDPEAHQALVQILVERRAKKTYLALVWGCPHPREGRWEWALGPDRKDRRRMAVEPGGKPSASTFSLLTKSKYVSLLSLQPETGRTHQLRVHCAQAGHPIVGDDLYGGPRHKSLRDQSLREHLQAVRPLLHAWSLHLPSSEAAPEIILQAPLPKDFAALLKFLGIVPPA